ncbi:TetR/AcrR family transcriptional regulator [Rhizobium sp. BT-175]|uniref:TetR/AcrR family transcriptional regulator n=1 Tax=Rhizobium sp. BT-175 TaxID=2986929 RepID=UPI002235C9CB|nr:TetR/AcrR family transcriptional regulator [Rhizobium sp. BT-175]MCV9945097.1 TetR/AcrR family transcriptional regulator [Rhizobium sp. BT-175]
MKSSSSGRRGPKPKPGTRDNLVKAGLRMFHNEGYAATGVQGIAESVGVPKGSFYNHFPSKEVFGAEVLDAYFDRNEEKLRSVVCDSGIPPLARLQAYFDERIKAFETAGFVRGCLIGNISAEVADHSVLMRQHLSRHFGSWTRFFEACIAQAQDEGTVGRDLPAALLARFVLNSWEGALLRMRAEKSNEPLRDFRAIIFDVLLK